MTVAEKVQQDLAVLITQDPILCPEDTATYVGVAEPTLATWRCRGGGPKFLKLGRKVGYQKSDLDRWLESRRVSFAAQLND